MKLFSTKGFIFLGLLLVLGFGCTSSGVQIKSSDYAVRLDGEENNFFERLYISREWKKRVADALEPSDCTVEAQTYPPGYYTGPLIETHLHIPQLSDDFGGGPDESKERGVDADLYDSIAPEDNPRLGVNVTIDSIACVLKKEGSTKAFSFFPVFPESPAPLIDVARVAKERHGDLFIPFIQSTSQNISTVEAGILRQMLAMQPGVFVGFGEIGDSPTESQNPPPDAPIYIGGFEVADEHNLMVYFHPGEGHHRNLDRAFRQFPNVTFLIHGDFVRPHVDWLMARNKNVYFTANDIFEEITHLFRFGDKQEFIEAMEQDWDTLLAQALRTYKPLIEKYPDRFMWGTDRADIAWNYDADVGILLSRFGRAFIGRLDPAVQEKFAYQNAERILGK